MLGFVPMGPLLPASSVLVCVCVGGGLQQYTSVYQCFDSIVTLILFGYSWELWIFQWIRLSWVCLISSMYHPEWQAADIKYSRLYIELKEEKAEFYS